MGAECQRVLHVGSVAEARNEGERGSRGEGASCRWRIKDEGSYLMTEPDHHCDSDLQVLAPVEDRRGGTLK